MRLHWTYDSGSYFEHDLEDADERRLMRCDYQVISQDKPIAAFEQAVNALLEREGSVSPEPSKKIISSYYASMNIMVFNAVLRTRSTSTARK